MSENQKQEYLEFAKKLAYKAGDIMRKYYGKNLDSHFKEDQTIVTIADEEINQTVIDEVQRAYPEHSINGEESSLDQGSSYVWVCDPIDGTNPFAMELSVSVFSLALVVDGVPELGVVYDPNGDKLYYAINGEKAYMNGKPITVNTGVLEKKSRVNIDWWSDADYDVMSAVHKMSYDTGAYCLTPGSTTHAAVLVARGEFVASIFPGTKGKNVDIAAAKVIVEAAGGKVTDLFGNEQRYDQDIRGSIVSNGIVHDQIVAYMRGLETREEGGKR